MLSAVKPCNKGFTALLPVQNVLWFKGDPCRRKPLFKKTLPGTAIAAVTAGDVINGGQFSIRPGFCRT